jgi:hypothetical protein
LPGTKIWKYAEHMTCSFSTERHGWVEARPLRSGCIGFD